MRKTRLKEGADTVLLLGKSMGGAAEERKKKTRGKKLAWIARERRF